MALRAVPRDDDEHDDDHGGGLHTDSDHHGHLAALVFVFVFVAPSTSTKKVVQGTAISTSKGTVQVQVTFEGDKIGSVSMLQQPNHPQTTAAVPVLIEETLKAQSSKIDTVSGATITSDAYVQSLQAAIDTKGA